MGVEEEGSGRRQDLQEHVQPLRMAGREGRVQEGGSGASEAAIKPVQVERPMR